MKKNLVLGILDNYSFHQVKKFVLSLKQTGFTGDLCLFLGSKTTPYTVQKLRENGVLVQFFDTVNTLPAGNLALKQYPLRSPINYFNYRHYLYLDFLLRHGHEYQHVLLTDVRDVYFQRDPFDFEPGEGLNCALEGKDKQLKDCSFNGPWMKYIYGQAGIDKLGNTVISCAGTSWGTVPVVIDYLHKMLTEIQKVPDAKIAIDQAIHNYMIYSGMLDKVHFLNNDEGIILTLSYEKNYTVENDKVKVLNGRTVNVLHQFDRMPDLKELTDKLYLRNDIGDYITYKFTRVMLTAHKILLFLRIRKPYYIPSVTAARD